jgi:DNA-binding response OmpR family regulator
MLPLFPRATMLQTSTTVNPDMLICPCCLSIIDGLQYLADPVTRKIAIAGKTVSMSGQQFRLANYLLARYPLNATRDQIYHAVFMNSRGEGPEAKIIDVTISGLRPVLADLGFAIQTIWGSGYKLLMTDPATAKQINASNGRQRKA